MNAAITFELQIDGGYHVMLDLMKMNCYIPNGKPVDSYYILFGDSLYTQIHANSSHPAEKCHSSYLEGYLGLAMVGTRCEFGC